MSTSSRSHHVTSLTSQNRSVSVNEVSGEVANQSERNGNIKPHSDQILENETVRDSFDEGAEKTASFFTRHSTLVSVLVGLLTYSTFIVTLTVILVAVVDKGFFTAANDYLLLADETELWKVSAIVAFTFFGLSIIFIKPFVNFSKKPSNKRSRLLAFFLVVVGLFVFSAIGLMRYLENRKTSLIPIPTPTVTPTSTPTPTFIPTPTLPNTPNPTMTPEEFFIDLGFEMLSSLDQNKFDHVLATMTPKLQAWMQENSRWETFTDFWGKRSNFEISRYYDGEVQFDEGGGAIWLEFLVSVETDEISYKELWEIKIVFLYLNASNEWRINQFEFGEIEI